MKEKRAVFLNTAVGGIKTPGFQREKYSNTLSNKKKKVRVLILLFAGLAGKSGWRALGEGMFQGQKKKNAFVTAGKLKTWRSLSFCGRAEEQGQDG